MGPQAIRGIGARGLIRPAQVDDVLTPDSAVTEVFNFHFDRIGAATVRPGMAALGATVLASRPCVGLWNAQSGTGLAVFSNGGSSTIYSLSGTTWSVSLDGGTASVRIRFVDFGSYTIALNFIYNTYTSMRYWNAGSSRHWHNTGNPINVQNMWGRAPQLGEVYKSRIYLAGDTSAEGNGSRLYYSAVITSAGIVTWAPTTDFVDINPGDGEVITGLKRYGLELVVFKPNYIYRFKTNAVDPDPLIKIGTRSQESVVEGKRALYFHHDSGFYRYTGAQPERISLPVLDIVEAIPFSQFDDIVGWSDDDHIYWSVGNVTVTENGLSETWRNVVLRYTESTEVWTMYSMAFDVRRGMTYNSGSALSRIVGLDTGVVATFNSGVTDIREPIEYRIRTKWYEWEGVSTRKILKSIVAICDKAQASELSYQVDEDTKWYSVGQMKRLNSYFDNLSISFHRIRFRVSGITRFEAPVIKGFEFLDGINEGLSLEPK